MSLERQVRAKVSKFRAYPEKRKTIQIFAQIAAKRNPQQDQEAQEWIETVLGKKFPAGELYEDVIRDGVVLCQLINKLVPGAVPKVNTSGGQFKFMENINKYVNEQAINDFCI